MAVLETHFYHKSITLVVGVFGSIFNDIKIIRDDGKTIKVPIAYAPGQKYNQRMDEREDLDQLQFMKRTPRMSFRLQSFARDIARVKNRRHKLIDRDNYNTVDNAITTQYNRVPYNFSFRLDIGTKYVDDMLQVIEQILATFNPSLQVVVNDNPDLSGSSSYQVTLNDVQMEDQFEGSFEESREVITTMDFTVEGYLYQATDNHSVIKTVYVDYFDAINSLIESDVYTEADLP